MISCGTPRLACPATCNCVLIVPRIALDCAAIASARLGNIRSVRRSFSVSQSMSLRLLAVSGRMMAISFFFPRFASPFLRLVGCLVLLADFIVAAR